MATLFTRTRSPLVAGRRPLAGAPSNIAAPAIVTPPSGLVWDYATAENGTRLQWPLTNNQFDSIVARLDGEYRDWGATLSGEIERYGGVRYYYAWTNILASGSPGFETTAYPQWQPAFREVFNVYRKGTSGQAARTLVFECMHNTAAVPVGDTVWFYLSTEWQGGVETDRSIDVGGFNLPLFGKLTCSGGAGSPDDPIHSRSYVEVTFQQDLPPIDWSPPFHQPVSWMPPLPRLILVHHSFYADARTKTLRFPYSWHYDVIRYDVVGNNGHLILGGYQGIPIWRDWTHLFNWMGDLAIELFRFEKEALADKFGDMDPRMVIDEMENEPVVDWLDNQSSDKPLGFRRSLLEIMYPTARNAWGPERTFLLKGTGFGSIRNLYTEWDLDNGVHFGGGNNMIGNHNYSNGSKGYSDRDLWYGDRGDCDWHAGTLRDVINRGKFKGGGMAEWGVPNWEPMPLRAQMHGRLHTAMHAQGLFVAFWDVGGDANAMAWLYRDVPGKEGKVVQALDPETRPYTGRAGRTQ